MQALIFSKEPFNQEVYDGHIRGLQRELKKFEDLYIKDSGFIFGDDMSIADLLGINYSLYNVVYRHLAIIECSVSYSLF